MPEEQLATKQHPIPQQVFGVKFKLVGNLTMRQFLILAICGFFAYLFFSSDLFFLFRIIISGIFLLFGAAFAFLPVQDQPLDQWITAFFHAVYAPTRRIWGKSLKPAEFLILEVPKLAKNAEPGLSAEESRRRLEIYLSAIHEQKELSPLDLAEEQYLGSIRTMAQKLMVDEVSVIPSPPPPTPIYTPALTLEEVLATPTAPATTFRDAPAPKFVEAGHIAERPSLASVVNFNEPVYKVQRGQVSSYFAARRNVRVGRRLTPLAIAGMMVYAPAREQMLALEPPVAPETPATPEPPVAPVAPEVPVVPVHRAAAKPNTPPQGGGNVIAGTIFDPQGGILAQTLIVFEDEKGRVVRAIKTSELGRFATSPLPNGRYAVKIPKAPFSFATIEVELTGGKVPELEIRSQIGT